MIPTSATKHQRVNMNMNMNKNNDLRAFTVITIFVISFRVRQYTFMRRKHALFV